MESTSGAQELFEAYEDEFAVATYELRKSANALSHEATAHYYEAAVLRFAEAAHRLITDLRGAMQDFPSNELAQDAFKAGLQATLWREEAEGQAQ